MSNDLIDENAINQLLEMDDEDPEHEFSREILLEFFTQLNNKVPEFDSYLQENDYDKVGKLGHFLKGSSAGVGAAKIREICDDIQHWQTKTADPQTYFHEKVKELKNAIPETKRVLYEKVGWIA